MFQTNNNPWELNEAAAIDTAEFSMNLIVWNDEVNTFEWVIETLMDVCNHTQEQAEQCAMLTL